MNPPSQPALPTPSGLNNLNDQSKLLLIDQIFRLPLADESLNEKLSSFLDGLDATDVFEIVGSLNEAVCKETNRVVLPLQLIVAKVLLVIKEQDAYKPAYKTWGEFLKQLNDHKGLSKSNYYKWRNYLWVYDRMGKPENLPSLVAITEAHRVAKGSPLKAAQIYEQKRNELGREPTSKDFPKAKPTQTLAAYIKGVSAIAKQFLEARQFDQAKKCIELISAAATSPSDITCRLSPPEFFRLEAPAGSFEPKPDKPNDFNSQEKSEKTETMEEANQPVPTVTIQPKLVPEIQPAENSGPLFPEVQLEPQIVQKSRPLPANWGKGLGDLAPARNPLLEPPEAPETTWGQIKKRFFN